MSLVVAGGGPAGAAAAIMLAEGGERPLVLERTREDRDVVCGGFLGWDALALLGRLGIDADALGARPITRLRIVGRARTVETALPRAAAGLSRQTLDAALLRRAMAAGATVERGATIRAAEDGVLRLGDGATLRPDTLFLATGKHDLRGHARPTYPGAAVGLRAALPPDPTIAGAIVLHPFDGGYAGFLTQEDGRTNLCLSIAPARLAAAGGTSGLAALLEREAPRLAEILARAPADGWSAIAGVPYGWRAGTTAPGLFRIGDQAAVIASLAGDGVAIALASGRAAARAFLANGRDDAAAYQRGFAATARRPLRFASTARGFAEDPRTREPLLALLAGVPGIARLLARATRIGDDRK